MQIIDQKKGEGNIVYSRSGHNICKKVCLNLDVNEDIYVTWGQNVTRKGISLK